MKKDFTTPKFKHTRDHSLFQAMHGELGEDAVRIAEEEYEKQHKEFAEEATNVWSDNQEQRRMPVSQLVELACKKAKNTPELISFMMTIGTFVESENHQCDVKKMIGVVLGKGKFPFPPLDDDKKDGEE